MMGFHPKDGRCCAKSLGRCTPARLEGGK